MHKNLGWLGLSIWLASAPAGAVTAKPAEGASPRVVATPTAPSAPLAGVIVSVDAQGGHIVISGQKFLISQPLVAVIDKRPKSDGLLSVATLLPGMNVRYRVDRGGSEPRVVELWVLRNADAAKR